MAMHGAPLLADDDDLVILPAGIEIVVLRRLAKTSRPDIFQLGVVELAQQLKQAVVTRHQLSFSTVSGSPAPPAPGGCYRRLPGHHRLARQP
jgi:hypothetical protein